MTGFGTNHQNMKGQNFPKNGPILLKAAIKAHEKGNIEKAESLYIKTIMAKLASGERRRVEPPTRFELVTSPLPWERSTPELGRHMKSMM